MYSASAQLLYTKQIDIQNPLGQSYTDTTAQQAEIESVPVVLKSSEVKSADVKSSDVNGASQRIDVVDDFGQSILESPAGAIRPGSVSIVVVQSKGQSTCGDLDGRRRQSPRIASELGLCWRRSRRGVLLFEESERQMLAAGHDDETRFLNAHEYLVSPAEGFVGQLQKDRSASGQKSLRDGE